jgi:hypothetical protein
MLWFVVDLYHRQRYFFICGCKRIVTKRGVKNRRQSFERRESATVSLSPVSGSVSGNQASNPSGLSCAGSDGFHPIF